jgi:hypothetical protein
MLYFGKITNEVTMLNLLILCLLLLMQMSTIMTYSNGAGNCPSGTTIESTSPHPHSNYKWILANAGIVVALNFQELSSGSTRIITSPGILIQISAPNGIKGINIRLGTTNAVIVPTLGSRDDVKANYYCSDSVGMTHTNSSIKTNLAVGGEIYLMGKTAVNIVAMVNNADYYVSQFY